MPKPVASTPSPLAKLRVGSLRKSNATVVHVFAGIVRVAIGVPELLPVTPTHSMPPTVPPLDPMLVPIGLPVSRQPTAKFTALSYRRRIATACPNR